MTREEAIEWFETHMPTKITPVAKQSYLIAIAALRPVSREQVEKVWKSYWITVCNNIGERWSKCCDCQNELDGMEDGFLFCPYCGAPMTDEAVEMVVERLEALHEITE